MEDAERALVLFGLGRALALQGREGQEELREAAAALIANGWPELAAEAEVLLGDLAWFAGNRAETDQQLVRALALVEPLPPSRSKAWILAQAARMAMLAARFDEALEFGEPALALAESLDLPDVRLNVAHDRGRRSRRIEATRQGWPSSRRARPSASESTRRSSRER